MHPDWQDWGRPDVRGTTGIAPFRSPVEVVLAIEKIIAAAIHPEGWGPAQRSQAELFDRRIAGSSLPYADALRALELAPIVTWCLHAALVYELEPGLAAPTVASCAHVASAITGGSPLAGFAAALELARLELWGIEPGGKPLRAREVRVAARVLELVLATEPPGSPIAIIHEPSHPSGADDPELVDRIGAALAAGPPRYIGGRACVPAIVAVATELGVPVAIATAGDPPGAVVREALLAGAIIVIVDGDPWHPAWRLHRHGVMVVGDPPLTT